MNETVERARITDLTPDPHNANKGTERGRYVLGRSLEKNGAGRSILLDRNLNIIAGNKTHERALALGLEDVLLVHTDGKSVVGIVRDDLDLNDPNDPRARDLAYGDNRAAELGLEWDVDQIARDVNEGKDLSDYWTPEELDAKIGVEDADVGGEENRFEMQYSIVIDCASEEEQRVLLEQLIGEGLQCRALML